MQTINKFLLPVFTLFVLFSCQKEIEPEYQPLVFNGLVTTSNSFQAGSSVGIMADATGTNISYHWTYNSGEVTGGGDNINYSNENIGTYTIICTVVDGGGEVDSKQVEISVY